LATKIKTRFLTYRFLGNWLDFFFRFLPLLEKFEPGRLDIGGHRLNSNSTKVTVQTRKRNERGGERERKQNGNEYEVLVRDHK
jgi:hypothetical protein